MEFRSLLLTGYLLKSLYVIVVKFKRYIIVIKGADYLSKSCKSQSNRGPLIARLCQSSKSILKSSGSESMVLTPGALPGILLEIKILGPCPRLTESGVLRVQLSNLSSSFKLCRSLRPNML